MTSIDKIFFYTIFLISFFIALCPPRIANTVYHTVYRKWRMTKKYQKNHDHKIIMIELCKNCVMMLLGNQIIPQYLLKKFMNQFMNGRLQNAIGNRQFPR